MENVMTWTGLKVTDKKRTVLALILATVMLFTGCTAQWISVALADLPVLLQMGLNIAQLVGTIGGTPPTQAEINAINDISAEANKDLTLLQNLYNQYKAGPSAALLGQIEGVIADINNNLPALLTAAHIKDLLLEQRVAAAVNLILTTVTAFAGLIPQPQNATVIRMKAKATKVPKPNDLKKQWNAAVYPQF